jgi:acyl dehydratase
MREFTTFEELAAAVGEDVGTTDWVEVTQERVDAFAEATGDHQWIHVDVQRAQSGPFGGTIAHGYLTLSMIPLFNTQLFQLSTPGARLNYGLNRVRFPAPVRVGARIRAHLHVVALAEVASGKQLVLRYTVEIEGEPKPALAAEWLTLAVLG